MTITIGQLREAIKNLPDQGLLLVETDDEVYYPDALQSTFRGFNNFVVHISLDQTEDDDEDEG